MLSRRTVLVLVAGAAMPVPAALGGHKAGHETGQGAAGQEAPGFGEFGRRIRFGFRPVDPLVTIRPDGTYTGLEFELLTAACAAAGLTVDPYPGPNTRLTEALERGVVEAIAPAVGLEERYPHSATYLTYRNVAVSLAERGLDIRTIGDLARHSIMAFQRADRVLGPEFHQAARLSPNYLEEGKQFRQAQALFNGRFDVIVGEHRIIRHFIRQAAQEGQIVPKVVEHDIFPPIYYRVAFRDPVLRDRFDQGLAAIRADGRHDAIVRKWDDGLAPLKTG